MIMVKQTRRQFLTLCAAGLCGACCTAVAQGDSKEADFTFAAINDPHIKDEPSTAIIERAVKQINADTRIGMTLVLGDMATVGAKAELELARGALDKLARPWNALPGNHDVFMRDEDIYANYTAVFGPAHWFLEHHGWAFIGFDSCEGVKSDVTVAEAELAWLREQAARVTPGQPVALLCHHPLNPNTASYRILNADTILAIFKDCSLHLAAAGHYHGNQVEEPGDTLFTTTACCSSTRGNFDKTEARGYRLFHIKGNTVETEFVEVPLEAKEV